VGRGHGNGRALAVDRNPCRCECRPGSLELRGEKNDRDIVLEVLDASRRIISPKRSDYFTRVEIVLFSGRSLEAKRTLYAALVRNLSALGVPAEQVKTVLIEVPTENWGLRGGVPASEIDLGFEIRV
jgi:hypothetical protein